MKKSQVNLQRITEIDALRGICLIGVFLSHLYFDISLLYSVPGPPPAIDYLFEYGGIIFVLISGISVMLGHHAVKRGALVFLCAMMITAVTYLLSKFLEDESMVVRFGILHLLGICMILSPVLKNLNSYACAILGISFIFAGIILNNMRTEIPWLFPLGYMTPTFSSSDYWPILPNIGYFMIGIVLGKVLYPARNPILPGLQGRLPVLCYLGRNSLWVYLIQQPVCFLLIFLSDFLFVHKYFTI